jgi:hypothetical protein
MKGPLRRIRFHRRPSAAAPQETQATVVAPPEGAMTQPLPAGVTPQDVAPIRPTFRNRGRLRRRLRYLRRVRELGFRDLGGLVFDLHRFGRRADELVLGKLAALQAVDREMRALERALDERQDIIELREPGIAACARCGALHGSEARFCPSCGTPVHGPRAIAEVGEAVSLPGGDVTPAPHTPAPLAQPAGPMRLQPQPLASAPPTPVPTPPAPPAPGPPHAGEPSPAAPPAADGERSAAHHEGEQPTEVMRRPDEEPGAADSPDQADAADGTGAAEAMAQPSGKPHEP